MDAIVLQPQLMAQVVMIASQESRKPDELIETAVRDYLRGLQRKKIEVEVQAYESMHGELVKTHLGRYVALHRGKLVDFDKDFQSLHQRVRQRYGNEAVLIRRVEALPQPELLFRSPRTVATPPRPTRCWPITGSAARPSAWRLPRWAGPMGWRAICWNGCIEAGDGVTG